jgi:hypothetical protein
MKAVRLFYQRIDYDDGGIVEMTIWRVPAAVPPTTHDLKYSLYYGRRVAAMSDTTMSAARATTGMSRAGNRHTGLRPSSNL